jgi:hypothetical protein
MLRRRIPIDAGSTPRFVGRVLGRAAPALGMPRCCRRGSGAKRCISAHASGPSGTYAGTAGGSFHADCSSVTCPASRQVVCQPRHVGGPQTCRHDVAAFCADAERSEGATSSSAMWQLTPSGVRHASYSKESSAGAQGEISAARPKIPPWLASRTAGHHRRVDRQPWPGSERQRSRARGQSPQADPPG